MNNGRNETLATYHYGNKHVDIVGYWYKNNDRKEYTFYDIFLVDSGECLNEGYYLFTFPSYQQVKKFLEDGFTGRKNESNG